MTKEMIISSNGHETMVAILEDDLVAEIFVERERQRGVVGNVYKGRVSKVLPGMQSSFIDLGLERDGFLYVADVIDTMEEFDKLEAGDEERRPQRRRRSAGQDRDRDKPQPKIEDLLKEGQEILVQVVKEPLGTKGARLTSHVTMAGRFLVFMPTVDHVGVSRKIESRDERGRLRGIVREFREAHGFTGGVIIRTAAAGRPKEDIVSDLEAFHKIWTEIRQRTESSRAPAVVYREQSLVGKLLRDLLTDEFQAIRIDNAQEHQRVLELVERIMPNARAEGEAVREAVSDLRRVRRPGRDRQGAQEQGVAEVGRIDRHQPDRGARRHRRQHRPLRRQEDRAGRLEDTIVKTNLEAVKEIVRQVRLRDLGGIIVLDFIDMEEKKNRQKVLQAVELELKKDRSPSKALQVSDFGLVIITRKRVKQSLERVLTEPCPYCSGTGVIKSSSTICYEILSEVKKVGPDLNGHRLLLRVNPDIARALKEEESAVLKRSAAVDRQGRHHQAGRPASSRAVRRDGGVSERRVRRVGRAAERSAWHRRVAVHARFRIPTFVPKPAASGSGSGCRPC